MKLSNTDKRKIAARLFFRDNREAYDSFEDALYEFEEGKQSEQFIDFVVKPILAPTEGHVLLMRDDGHVGTLRLSDNYFEPRTEMIQEEGEELKNQFETVNQANLEDDELQLLEKMGWKQI